jgi:hypothetical protein
MEYKITCICLKGAAMERVFSITNALWTDERSRFLVETIKAVIVTKTHSENFHATTSML